MVDPNAPLPSNPSNSERERKISRFSVGPGLIAGITFLVIILAAFITYILFAH